MSSDDTKSVILGRAINGKKRVREDSFSSAAIFKGYEALHKWIDKTMEPVRSELYRVLFPVLAMAYKTILENEEDNAKGIELLDVWYESHADRYARELKELEAKGTYLERVRNSLFVLRLSPVAAELLGEFLTRTASVSIIKLLNEKIRIEIRQNVANVNDSREPILVEEDKEINPGKTADLGSKRHDQPLGLETEPLYLGSLQESALVYGKHNELTSTQGNVPPSFAGRAAEAATNAYAAALLRDHARRRLDEAEPTGRHLKPSMEPAALMATVTGGDAELVCSLKPSNDARRLAAGMSDSSLRVWRLDSTTNKQQEAHLLKTKANSRSATAHRGPLYSLSWSTEARFLLSGGADGCSVLWDTEGDDFALNAVCRYRCHGSRPTWSVAFCPLSVGHLFATAGGDRTCRVFATERLEPLRIFVGHWSPVLRTVWHPNAHYLASCDATSVRLWDIRAAGGHSSKSHCVRILEPATPTGADFSALDISPDGQYAAAADREGYLHIWHIDSGKTIAAGPTATNSSLEALAFSRDSATLATGGTDYTLRLWDANSINLDSRTIQSPPRLTFKTRGPTPIFDISWTPSNLCLVAGVLLASP